MNETITIQIGNSDDHLTQKEWSAFVADVRESIERLCHEVHFFGAPSNYASWQNAAWVISMSGDFPELISTLRNELCAIRKRYKQESIAWTEGKTYFI